MEPKEVPEVLPPPPPVIPPNVVPIRFTAENVPEEPKRTSSKKLVPMARRDVGSRGKTIELLCNHFKVTIKNADDYFYHYSISLSSGDGRPVNQKGIGRKLIDKVRETYYADLAGKDFAYDGANSLFTVGSLRNKRMEFTVLLDNFSSNRDPDNGSPKERDKKRTKHAYRSKTFKVNINYAARIPIHAITAATRDRESENSQEALRVLDIILRQHAAKKGCLLVRQSFFHNDPRSFVDLGGGVHGCRGFHSSFRVTQAGLSLNMDGSTTTIIMPGPLSEFLLANQNVSDSYQINWGKAKRTLKNLLIKVSPSNQEYKITGISENRCREQMFSMKSRKNDRNEVETVDITVYKYYLSYRNMDLRNSADLPCINVGKPKRPVYIPVELCSLLPLQRYTKALSVIQRAELVEKSRQKPQEKMNILTNAMERNDYDAEPMLHSCGITISSQFTKVEGRVLSAPMLKVGNGEDFIPRNGRWNFNNKQFFEPVKIEHWAVVNFSARCDNVRGLCRDLRRFGEMKGILISSPAVEVIEENAQVRRFPPPVRVEKMFEQLKKIFPKGPPSFILCLLPEKKNSELYGPWKRKSLAEFGIFTQCLAPGNRAFNEQYITNILLKINAKVGGFNSLLPIEKIPLVSQIPTIIFGMDVSHGTPGQADMPSIAAVVSSRNWPQLSCYRASVRSQSPKVEMIDSLFKPTEKDGDAGIVRELLKDFYLNSHKAKPAHIIVFRDGVSESQFSQVLNVELDQIIKACEFLDRSWSPKFTVIVAQKNHHTKIFKAQSSQDNVPPGTIIDNGICHAYNNDFYLCAHAGAIGTTRPTHYHVLLDEVGFSADDLQELVHSLSYVYQRSTTAISVVAPIRYAHLAAAQSLQFLKFDNMSSKASTDGGTSTTSSKRAFVPELPVLHQKVGGSMFFC